MAPQTLSAVAEFRQQLIELNREYLCSPEPPAHEISVRFLGRFEGQAVVWDMRLHTLALWQRPQLRPESEPARHFMQIHRDADGTLRIEVALNVAEIDHPTIRKTIVMIRNYKLLSLGRHEWGGKQVAGR